MPERKTETQSETVFVEHAGHHIACLAHRNPAATQLPVVWLHGLTTSVRFWEAAMYEEIKAERSWFSMSLPFHHPSTYEGEIGEDSLNENLLAELVAKPLDTLIPEGRFHLVGHSVGAFAALNYASKFPGRAASVVSIGGLMSGRAKGLEGLLEFMAEGRFVRKAIFHIGYRLLQSHRFFLTLATLLYAHRRGRVLASPDLRPTIRNIFPDVQRHSVRAQRAFCRSLIGMDLCDEVESIEIPVLAMVGEKDPVIPPAHQLAYARRLPNGQIEIFPRCGHLCFVEEAGQFEKALFRWLSAQDGP